MPSSLRARASCSRSSDRGCILTGPIGGCLPERSGPGQHDVLAVARANQPAPGEPFRLTFVHRTERSTTVVAAIPAGGGIRAHVHDEHDEVVTFVEGEVDFRFDVGISRVRSGQTISVPAGAVHGPIRSPNGCVLVSVYAPGFDPDHPDRRFVDE